MNKIPLIISAACLALGVYAHVVGANPLDLMDLATAVSFGFFVCEFFLSRVGMKQAQVFETEMDALYKTLQHREEILDDLIARFRNRGVGE